MTIITNFTRYPVNIVNSDTVRFDKQLKRFISDNPEIKTIPPSGILLRISYRTSEGPVIEGIKTTVKNQEYINPIPDDCDIAIVSHEYALVSKDPRAYIVSSPVYDSTGSKIIGSLNLSKYQYNV